MRRAKIERWEGGRVRTTAKGERRWEIRKRIAGYLYEVTLDVGTPKEALVELARFLQSPERYRTASSDARQRAAEGVSVDADGIADFLAYLTAEGRSKVYRGIVRAYLGDWGEALNGADLRGLDAKGLRKTLAGWGTARKHRIIVFKSYCSWLEGRGDLDPRDNPGRFLTVPTARRTHDAKAYSIETIERLYSLLPTQFLRDLLCIQAHTGMHVSEVDRLARGGGTLKDVADCAPIAGTISFKHKTGATHVLSIDAQTLAAARRLVAVGRAPSVHAFHDAVKVLAKRAEEKGEAFEKVNPGALRHSFTTWAVECGTEVQPKGRGLSLEKVAERLGHTNTRTTRVHYLDVSVPPMIVVPISLRHPDDPKAEGGESPP